MRYLLGSWCGQVDMAWLAGWWSSSGEWEINKNRVCRCIFYNNVVDRRRGGEFIKEVDVWAHAILTCYYSGGQINEEDARRRFLLLCLKQLRWAHAIHKWK